MYQLPKIISYNRSDKGKFRLMMEGDSINPCSQRIFSLEASSPTIYF